MVDKRLVGWILVVCGILVLGIAGCQPESGPERVHLRGSVTYAGKPVVTGRILITPLPGTNAPVTTIDFKDGTYDTHSAAGKGVPVGQHRVEIIGYMTAELPPKNANDFAPPPPSDIPPKYNDQSTLTLDLPSGGESEMVKDFVLVP